MSKIHYTPLQIHQRFFILTLLNPSIDASKLITLDYLKCLHVRLR